MFLINYWTFSEDFLEKEGGVFRETYYRNFNQRAVTILSIITTPFYKYIIDFLSF